MGSPIKGYNLIENKPIIDDLISRLSSIQSEKAKEMLLLANADYEIYLNRNEGEAIKLINEALSSNKRSTSLLERKFATAEKAKKTFLMEEVLGSYEALISNSNGTVNEQNNLNIMKAKLLGHKGQKTQTINLLKTNVKYFPENSINRLIEQIEDL